MSVVINDFEIVPEAAETDSDEEDEDRVPEESAAVEPIDLAEVLSRERRRRCRLRAH